MDSVPNTASCFLQLYQQLGPEWEAHIQKTQPRGYSGFQREYQIYVATERVAHLDNSLEGEIRHCEKLDKKRGIAETGSKSGAPEKSDTGMPNISTVGD